jgi:antitoxin MazE
MRANIVKIGNSHGIRIPKALLQESGLAGEVEITARRGTLVIRPVATARAGWEVAFEEMARHGDDPLLDDDQPLEHSFDEEEWEWK